MSSYQVYLSVISSHSFVLIFQKLINSLVEMTVLITNLEAHAVAMLISTIRQ